MSRKLTKNTVFKKILEDGRIYSIYPRTSTDIVYYNESETLTDLLNDIYDKISGGKPDIGYKSAIKYVAVSEDGKTVKFYRTNIVDEDTEADFTYTIPNTIVKKKTFLEFPPIGDSSCIYIDDSESATYIWDNTSLRYICTGRDYNNIKVIDGGNSDPEDEDNI